jgi:hypothetical protein
VRELIKCKEVNLNREFNTEESLLHFLFLFKTYLRCKFREKSIREKYFGSAREHFMSRVLYTPKIRDLVIESIEVCVIDKDASDYVINCLEEEILKLYEVFSKHEMEYYAKKTVEDVPDLGKFFKNCMREKKRGKVRI